MKLGLLLPTLHSLELNAGALRAAEQLGADDVWVLDHMMGFTHPDLWRDFPASAALPDSDALLDPFVVAAALGPTTDLRVGLSVTDATRRRGADLARASMTLNDACKGGFVLGLGSGEAESIVPFGYDYEKPVGSLERALQEIRSLLDSGTMPDGSGRTGMPRESVPEVWVAAQRPRMLRLTGRYADGWIPLPSEPEEYAEQYATVKQAADQAGRTAPLASICPATIFGESRDVVAATLEEIPIVKLMAYYVPDQIWRKYGLEHPGGPGCRGQIDLIPHELDPDELRELAPRIPLELLEELAWIGSAEAAATAISRPPSLTNFSR
jgi:phthiodiolone/phenolphthiodiolone dimycocerosates ketoreductase